MNFEHMRKLCGWHFSVLDVAVLDNFQMSPDLRGYVNIKPVFGEKVYGVLYNLDQSALDSLDAFEGFPEVFNREMIKVSDSENNIVDAWVYIESPEQFGGNYVREEYLNRVIMGATENHLPKEWIEYLKSLAAK
jgi:gamma-glutamylcyclotransferase (GGCT)/AIG2-like uncharacterized protein YtfP